MLLASNLLQTKALQKNQQSPLNRKTKTRHTGSFISPRLGKHATCKDTNGIFLKVLFHVLFFFCMKEWKNTSLMKPFLEKYDTTVIGK